jgi:hypothetical protein
MIPSYLNHIAQVMNDDKNGAKMGVMCPCGSKHFKLFTKAKSEHEIQRDKGLDQLFKEFGKRAEVQSDSNGNTFIVQKNFWGKEVKRVAICNAPEQTFWTYISTQCAFCGAEYVLFDERFHGYDACVSPCQKCGDVVSITYPDQAMRIEIMVDYSSDVDEDDLIKDKTLAFGRIKISAVSGRTNLTIIDWECA